jgi:hypothetical protein
MQKVSGCKLLQTYTNISSTNEEINMIKTTISIGRITIDPDICNGKPLHFKIIGKNTGFFNHITVLFFWVF